MEKYTTPEPHLVHGYGGHCPKYRYYIGGTYGHLTHKALLDPCVPHSKDINLSVIHEEVDADVPTKREREILREREQFVEAVHKDPIIPGYKGFLPRLREQIGKRYHAAATAAKAEDAKLMERLRCERRHLAHDDLLKSGTGLFEQKIGERLIDSRIYGAPLIPVKKRSQGVEVFDKCKYFREKEPYTKNTVPHFMENEDDEKWIIQGYAGHIPRARFIIGKSNKSLTREALNEFSDGVRYARYGKICDVNNIREKRTGCMVPDCEIYRSGSNIIPNYGGHVPGNIFQFGKRYAAATTNAKEWLRGEKLKRLYTSNPMFEEYCGQCKSRFSPEEKKLF